MPPRSGIAHGSAGRGVSHLRIVVEGDDDDVAHRDRPATDSHAVRSTSPTGSPNGGRRRRTVGGTPKSCPSRDSRGSRPRASFLPKAEFGSGSIFDIKVRGSVCLFELPTRRYLNECLLGMRLAPQRAELLEESDGPDVRISKLLADFSEAKVDWILQLSQEQSFQQWQRFIHTLESDAAQNTCADFFWLAVGVIFGCARDVDVCDRELMLARSWHRLCNTAGAICAGQPDHGAYVEARDATLAALPVMIVQAVYRLLVNAFGDEKHDFEKHAQPLLDKLMQLVHYEVCGFHMSIATCRELRQRHFRRHVRDFPFLNLHDSLKNDHRRELLERESKAPRPLTFGNGPGLEELQLQHVAEHRAEQQRQKRIRERLNGNMNSEEQSIAPFDLTVDHYTQLRQEGLSRLSALRNGFGMEEPEEEEEEPEDPESDHQTSADSGGSSENSDQDDDSRMPVPQRLMWRRKADLSHNIEQTGRMAAATVKESSRPEASSMGGIMASLAMGKRLMSKANERREERAAVRRQRKELMHRCLVENTSPPRVQLAQLRGIETCWVSPLCEQLGPKVDGRRLVDLRMAESQKLRMKSLAAAPLPRPSSTPSLRSTDRSALRAEEHTQRFTRTFGKSVVGSTGALSGSRRLASSASLVQTLKLGEPEAASADGNSSRRSDAGGARKSPLVNPAELQSAELSYVASLHQLVGDSKYPAQSQWDSVKWKALLRRRKGKL